MSLTNVIIEIHLILLFIPRIFHNISYHITEVLIFYADKLMVMGSSKSQKFDACEIYMFYSTLR